MPVGFDLGELRIRVILATDFRDFVSRVNIIVAGDAVATRAGISLYFTRRRVACSVCAFQGEEKTGCRQ